MPKKKKSEDKKKEDLPKQQIPKKKIPPEIPMEELDKKIAAAEKKLRKLGVEKDVWVKKPIDIDPSFHFFFTKLKNPKGDLMLKQHAGATVRLLKAAPYLKRGAVKHLDELVEFVTQSHEKTDPEENKESAP